MLFYGAIGDSAVVGCDIGKGGGGGGGGVDPRILFITEQRDERDSLADKHVLSSVQANLERALSVLSGVIFRELLSDRCECLVYQLIFIHV